MTHELRIGLIGLDTSHAPAFVRAINQPDHPDHVPGGRITAAVIGGSPDIRVSAERIDGFAREIRHQYRVPVVDDVSALLPQVDAVLLTSVDGRVHRSQAEPVIDAGLPLFIDKPMAASLADVRTLFDRAAERGTPLFSSSSLRFYPGLVEAIADPALGAIVGCEAYSPCPLERHHPDLMWYGIHGVEMLFTVLGPDSHSLMRLKQQDSEATIGCWSNERIGIFRGIRRGYAGYGATLYAEHAIRTVQYGGESLFGPLLQQILNFFRTGASPVSRRETEAIFAFMEAADASTAAGGSRIQLG
ncbi:Gfo/Idh/MocA family oxidoreductase [candidate division KSB1 bacterium]|nr:Gfo/Idh/MocA family oxidoreductase [candidate division KSB1 bacterium]